MRASPYPTLESQPEKRLVWDVALPGGQSCRFAKLWESRDPEVWYYYGGARALGAGEGPALVHACGYAGRVVTRVEELGEGVVRLEVRPYAPPDERPAAEAGRVGLVGHSAVTPPVAAPSGLSEEWPKAPGPPGEM